MRGEMRSVEEADDTRNLVARVASRDVRALARALTLVENGAACAGLLLAECKALHRPSRRVGVTGPAGAGKSTLVDQMVRQLRREGRRVGVIAIDPTSPFTGGALLGDRIRMQSFSGDPDVFIRSVASRGGTGGLAECAAGICLVMEAAGFDTVIVETVGVGQVEVAVTTVVDVTVLVLVPETGDEVQRLKAGIMEAADIFVVNKADQSGADKVEADLAALESIGSRPRPVVRTNALTGAGVADVLSLLEQYKPLSSRPSAAQSPVLDHVGIAVSSITTASSFYKALGVPVGHEEVVPYEQVKTAMVPLGTTRIELIEPTTADSVIGRFIAKWGEGLHHVAIRVDGIEARFSDMQAAGVRLASDAVRTGSGGHRYFFVHPASTGGVLVELVGD